MKVAPILSVHGRANILPHEDVNVSGKKTSTFAAQVSPLKMLDNGLPSRIK
jgi:hypothetical protein